MLMLIGVCLGLVPMVAAQTLTVHTSQGSGWILLDLQDLNGQLRQAGYPVISESAQLYGGSTFFPQPEANWQWGLTGLFWNAQGGQSVALNASFLGGLFDWTVRSLSLGRISAGLGAGFNMAQLSVRKGVVFSFEDVLHPSQGQFTQIQRWGVWGTPYLQYELYVLESDFFVRVWGGMILTPWVSNWSQVATLFEGVDFAGPPSNLGGPFGMAELSFGF